MGTSINHCSYMTAVQLFQELGETKRHSQHDQKETVACTYATRADVSTLRSDLHVCLRLPSTCVLNSDDIIYHWVLWLQPYGVFISTLLSTITLSYIVYFCIVSPTPKLLRTLNSWTLLRPINLPTANVIAGGFSNLDLVHALA